MTDQVIATENIVVHDDLLNIDRQLLAGQPVPPDLIDAYRATVGDAAAAQSPGEAATANAEQLADLQARLDTATGESADAAAKSDALAKERDDALDRISALEAELADVTKERDEAVAESGAGGVDYSKLSAEALKVEAAERDLTVEGTGANGNVKKTDLVDALRAADAK